MASPTQSSSAGQLANEALSGIPVVPAAAQLGINKDLFRNRDIVTQRIVIEDGAFFKGGIDIHKESAAKPAEVKEQAAAAGASASAAVAASPGPAAQASLLSK